MGEHLTKSATELFYSILFHFFNILFFHCLAFQPIDQRNSHLPSIASILCSMILDLQKSMIVFARDDGISNYAVELSRNPFHRLAQSLSDGTEHTFKEFTRKYNGILVEDPLNWPANHEDPLNWPAKLIAANSITTSEEREKSVCDAALLLGETEGIMKIVDECDFPILGPTQAAYIDEWRIAIKQKYSSASNSPSYTGDVSSNQNDETASA
ncbi:hypothetical protein ACH5RR_038653 [Cinchona calisaya]|uniref:Uncharacterized protein n=1 Tax=Cinchona calisaya TaxID=153742 RepID=A0ABD2Y010_9GENT